MMYEGDVKMMPSERSVWVDRVKTEREKAVSAHHTALRHAVEVINRSKVLTDEQKKVIIQEIYRDE